MTEAERLQSLSSEGRADAGPCSGIAGEIEQPPTCRNIFLEAITVMSMPMAIIDARLPAKPIVFANQALLDVTGYSIEEVLGQSAFFLDGPDSNPENSERYHLALKGGDDFADELLHHANDGRRLCLSMSGRALRNEAGNVTHHVLSCRDVTDQTAADHQVAGRIRPLEQQVMQRDRELATERAHRHDTEDRFRLIVEGARDYAIFTIDRDGKITDWHKGAEAVFGWTREEAVGQPFEMTFTPEDRAEGAPQWECDLASSAGSAPDVRWHICKDGSRVFIEGRTTSLRTTQGELHGFLKIGQNTTERRAAGQRQETLLLELQHRVRNILASVRSMVKRTARSSNSVSDYRAHLDGRINALARTQAQLTKSAGATLDLASLVRDEIDAQAAQPGQFTLSGPAVALPPKAAEVVALAVHELATNAAKYGAFSVSSGHVDVKWAIEAEDGEPWLRLNWIERGVRTQPVIRQGFGTELVTGRVPYELKGRGTMRIGESGAEATIEFPLRPGESILQTDASKLMQPDAGAT